jgi:hypothetical protein
MAYELLSQLFSADKDAEFRTSFGLLIRPFDQHFQDITFGVHDALRIVCKRWDILEVSGILGRGYG